eukprot:scaffold122456_cov41-Prasinocladus_malaysianus.AAC.1
MERLDELREGWAYIECRVLTNEGELVGCVAKVLTNQAVSKLRALRLSRPSVTGYGWCWRRGCSRPESDLRAGRRNGPATTATT